VPGRLEGADLGEQAVGGGPLRGVLGEAALDQRPHRGRHPVKVGGSVNDAIQQRRRCPRPERSLASAGEGQHRPEVEDIAGRPDFTAHGLLGRHEPRRSDHQAGLRQPRCLHGAGDAEVDDPRTVLGQQHVRRLEIPVHHAGGVDRIQALRQARGQRQQRRLGQRSVAVDCLGQRRPGNIGRSHPRHWAVDIGVHHRGGEHAAHPAGRRDLSPESRPELRIRGQLSADGLHRYRSPARGHAEEHLSHATLAEPSHQAVRADRGRISRLQFPEHATHPPRQDAPARRTRQNHDKYSVRDLTCHAALFGRLATTHLCVRVGLVATGNGRYRTYRARHDRTAPIRGHHYRVTAWTA
jgi:hypothetical protein